MGDRSDHHESHSTQSISSGNGSHTTKTDQFDIMCSSLSGMWGEISTRLLLRAMMPSMESLIGELTSRIVDVEAKLMPGSVAKCWTTGIKCLSEWSDELTEDVTKMKKQYRHIEYYIELTMINFTSCVLCGTHNVRPCHYEITGMPTLELLYSRYVHACSKLQIVQSMEAYQTASYIEKQMSFMQALECTFQQCLDDHVHIIRTSQQRRFPDNDPGLCEFDNENLDIDMSGGDEGPYSGPAPEVDRFGLLSGQEWDGTGEKSDRGGPCHGSDGGECNEKTIHIHTHDTTTVVKD